LPNTNASSTVAFVNLYFEKDLGVSVARLVSAGYPARNATSGSAFPNTHSSSTVAFVNL
jgi:hypothetical protein